jgi:phosphorylcholine metabolism protein LicD
MNGGLILCTYCGSKELLKINCSNDEKSSFFFKIAHMNLEGRMSLWCAKRIVVLYEKKYISLHLSINSAKITSLNNLVKHFICPKIDKYIIEMYGKKLILIFRIVIKFHTIKLIDSLVYIGKKKKLVVDVKLTSVKLTLALKVCVWTSNRQKVRRHVKS